MVLHFGESGHIELGGQAMENRIGRVGVCADVCHGFEMCLNGSPIGAAAGVAKDDHGGVAGFSVEAFDHYADLLFVRRASTALLSALSSEEGIVDYNKAGQQWTIEAVFHSGSQLVHQVPNGGVMHSHQVCSANSGDATLVLRHQKDQPEPDPKGDFGLVEHRASGD